MALPNEGEANGGSGVPKPLDLNECEATDKSVSELAVLGKGEIAFNALVEQSLVGAPVEFLSAPQRCGTAVAEVITEGCHPGHERSLGGGVRCRLSERPQLFEG